LQVAQEGIVLLKNEGGLLPLDKNVKSIAVIGPNADNERNQLGDYTSEVILQDIVTVLEGIINKAGPGCRVDYVKGCNVLRTDFNEIEKARKAAKNADVAIVVVGENERTAQNEKGERLGTDGEHKDVANLDLTGLQQDLIKAVHSTGTPTIVVLINGRPLSTRWAAENVPAIVEAWIPGERGGDAIADVLFGDYNPSGRLAITIPRHSGQLPMYYNYTPAKRRVVEYDWLGYVDMPSSPLYEFGFGLSYTQFEYSNLEIHQENMGIDSDVFVSVDVENTGHRPGQEVVQLYINDVISTVVTPYIELKGFEKISLEPGEKTTVRFTLTPGDLSFINTDMRSVVEPGRFDVMVGRSCEDIKLKGSFKKE
jgi:beta-glucosidase